jgi:hypothetical protein
MFIIVAALIAFSALGTAYQSGYSAAQKQRFSEPSPCVFLDDYLSAQERKERGIPDVICR